MEKRLNSSPTPSAIKPLTVDSKNCLLFNVCGNDLTKTIAKCLEITPVVTNITKFRNGETAVKEISSSMRGKHVYLIASVSDQINDEVMTTYLLARTCKRAKASQVSLILPCYPYARQDRKSKSREAESASDLAALWQLAGISRIITVDLHNPAITGFFDPLYTTVDNLSSRFYFFTLNM